MSERSWACRKYKLKESVSVIKWRTVGVTRYMGRVRACGKTYYEESRVYVGKSHMCFTHLQMYICVGDGATHE